jgi:RNA polymerase sigma-70 factor (ECF subfamily)
VEELSTSDAELVVRTRAGEAEALAELLERYRPSLYATAISLLRSRDAALDAVQETCLVAMTKLDALRDPAAVGGWLHVIVRNVCLVQLRRARETPREQVEPHSRSPVPTPEEALDQLALREWVWEALRTLTDDDRATVMLRYFSRCSSYHAIAAVTGVPVGTVRSRLHRARAVLSTALRRASVDTAFSAAAIERSRRLEWEAFYAELHEQPVPRTYRDAYAPDVDVSDSVGCWHGIEEWSEHEREAITLGVRAQIVGLVASSDLTILEIDFVNPAWANDHCPPRSTFIHQLAGGRSRRLSIHYV